MHKSTNEVVELIYSEAGVVIIVDQNETLMAGNPVGKIVKQGKKQFKKDYKKASERYVRMKPTEENAKKMIIDNFVTDKVGILQYTEEYVERKKYLDRQEDFGRQSEKEYKKMLQDLADPVVSSNNESYENVEKILKSIKK